MDRTAQKLESKQDLLDRYIELDHLHDNLIERAHRWHDEAIQQLEKNAIEAGIVSESDGMPWQYSSDDGKYHWQVDGLTHPYPWKYKTD